MKLPDQYLKFVAFEIEIVANLLLLFSYFSLLFLAKTRFMEAWSAA